MSFFLPFTAGPATIRAAYDDAGFVVVRGLLSIADVDAMRGELRQLIHHRRVLLGHAVDGREDLDAAYDGLCTFDRSLGGEIYRVAPDLPGYQRLINHIRLCEIAKTLVGAELLQIPVSNSNLRIDRPGETQFLFDWHQDYTFNLFSLNAVTAIIPLTDTTEEMGALHIIPGSHREISPVRINNPDFRSGEGGGGYIFELVEPTAALEARGVVAPLLAGDVLFLHCLAIHRSGTNVSKRNRWTVNPRYGDFLDKALTKRGWARGLQPGRILFRDIHPEKVV
jgi:phytanoyl-CoA hydroxylase